MTYSTICPVNSYWTEHFQTNSSLSGNYTDVILPHYGHFFILLPLAGDVFIDTQRVLSNQYIYVDPSHSLSDSKPVIVRPAASSSTLLVCAIAPHFVGTMSEFLGIPTEFKDVMSGIALPKGDKISECANALANSSDREKNDELLMDIVGQLIHLQYQRYQIIQKIDIVKSQTQSHIVTRLCKARQYIDACFLQPLTHEMIAREAMISESHFARLFKAAFDMTVKEYVLNKRLHYARFRLEEADNKIIYIADELGYRSLSAFITAFRKTFGLSPSAYKKKYRASILP